METMKSMREDPQPGQPPVPPTPAAKTKDHWSVELVGGFTVAAVMISALSMWYVFLVTALPLSA